MAAVVDGAPAMAARIRMVPPLRLDGHKVRVITVPPAPARASPCCRLVTICSLPMVRLLACPHIPVQPKGTHRFLARVACVARQPIMPPAECNRKVKVRSMVLHSHLPTLRVGVVVGVKVMAWPK